jgi:hypothetical protein
MIKKEKMKRFILSLLLVTFVGFAIAENEGIKDTKTTSSSATTISISGTVLDMNTGEALTGVEVTIDGTDIKAYSDFDGNFTISELSPGEYDIVASFISYKKSLVEDFNADGSQQVKIKLQTD